MPCGLRTVTCEAQERCRGAACSTPSRVPLQAQAIDNIPLSALISGYAIAYYCMRRCLQQNSELGIHTTYSRFMVCRFIVSATLLLAVACSSRDHPNPNGLRDSTSLSIDSLRCGQSDDHGLCNLYDVSLYELITRPAEFHGKRVRVIGFAHFEFESNGLFPHRED